MNNEQNRIAQLELDNAFLVAQLAKQNGLNPTANPQHAFNDAGNALQPPNALVRSQSNMGYGSGNAMMVCRPQLVLLNSLLILFRDSTTPSRRP